MLQETRSQLEWIVDTLAEKTHKTLAVKLVNSLQVCKDNVLFATQRLRQRDAIHLRDVIVNDVLERTNVADFRVNKLLHYQRLCPATQHSI